MIDFIFTPWRGNNWLSLLWSLDRGFLLPCYCPSLDFTVFLIFIYDFLYAPMVITSVCHCRSVVLIPSFGGPNECFQSPFINFPLFIKTCMFFISIFYGICWLVYSDHPYHILYRCFNYVVYFYVPFYCWQKIIFLLWMNYCFSSQTFGSVMTAGW